jgi:hypothetical protein
MSDDLDYRLTQTIEKMRVRQKAQSDLRSIENELRQALPRLQSLEEKLKKEQVDVNKLEKTSLSSLWASLRGSLEADLTREQLDLTAAQAAYQQHARRVNDLRAEQANLQAQLRGLDGLDAQYQSLLSEKERWLAQGASTAARQLNQINQQLAVYQADLKEITEAEQAGQSVLAHLNSVLERLGNAQAWGVWDMLGGGFLSTAVKHSEIDAAQQDLAQVQQSLSRFNRELKDIRQQLEVEIGIDRFDLFLDFFMDGLITDWIVQSKIDAALEQAAEARQAIRSALEKLKNARQRSEQQTRVLQSQREKLLTGGEAGG